MNKVKINTKDFLGLLVGTIEERMNCLATNEIFSSLEISDIKYIYQKELDRYKKEDGIENEIIYMLQVLAYNRHKSKYSEEIATFVLDKLFEMMSIELIDLSYN
ncbi:MAG: hypothetical protein DRG78_00950 [Epsilonproteobacteria bacterium]|nr:MAG: hypothetical protein DRG78_00950 [Campylobacterota bacterium]